MVHVFAVGADEFAFRVPSQNDVALLMLAREDRTAAPSKSAPCAVC